MVEKKQRVPIEKDLIYKITEFVKQESKPDYDEEIHRHVIVVLGAKNKQDRIDKVKNIMYNEIIDNEIPENIDGYQRGNEQNKKP